MSEHHAGLKPSVGIQAGPVPSTTGEELLPRRAHEPGAELFHIPEVPIPVPGEDLYALFRRQPQILDETVPGRRIPAAAQIEEQGDAGGLIHPGDGGGPLLEKLHFATVERKQGTLDHKGNLSVQKEV